ncbi:MAG: hypothetical protein V3U92_09120 [Cellulophaga sp.]
MRKIFVVIVLLFSCKGKQEVENNNTSVKPKVVVLTQEEKASIADLWEQANKFGLYSQKRQVYLDSILEIKPDSAYFWQQKAMPLYKARKYSLGKPFLEKAATLLPESYLDYSAFMKCIFSKEYKESIEEFLMVKEKFGDSYVMDHTYNFYLGLNYLQLNKFLKAKEYLLKSKDQQFQDFPDDEPHEACHYLDWYYLGVAQYELQEYQDALISFNNTLKVYTSLADAMYFKAMTLRNLGDKKQAKIWVKKALENANSTINEDNVFYEVYPYQTFHKLSPISRQE